MKITKFGQITAIALFLGLSSIAASAQTGPVVE